MASVLILAGDSVAVRSMIMSLEMERFTPYRASNGDELINRFVADTPGAVLCDLTAPWPALVPLLRRLRAHGSGKRYRLILFGERPPQANEAALQSLGLQEDDLFAEPVDMARLVQRLREAPPEVSATPRGGRSSLGFPFKGQLENVPLPRILALIGGGKGTGQLEVETRGHLVTLGFKDGELLAVSVPTGRYSLGDLLVGQGRMQEAQRQAVAKQGPITFEALVVQGVIPAHEIPQIAREQAEHVIRELMAEQAGGFRWNEGAAPRGGGFPLGVSVPRLILDGFKRQTGAILPPELAGSSPALDAKHREQLQGWGLLPYELRAVNQLNGARTVQTLVDELSMGSADRRQEFIGLMRALHAVGMLGGTENAPAEEVIDWTVREQQLRAELDRMTAADPFEVLGVTSKTPVAEIRSKFFGLSKQYHPDRAFGATPEVRELMEQIFRRVQEAYEIASDPKKKEEYIARKEEEQGGLDPKTAIKAEIAFTQGELFLKNRNYAKAVELFQQAVDGNAYAVEYKAYLGWAMFLADPSKYTEAAKLIHEVIKTNPNLDKGFYFLGCIFKARNELSQAENAFKKAVSVNPNNVDAQRELRLFSMRKDKGGAPQPAAKEEKKGAAGPEKKKSLFDIFRKS